MNILAGLMMISLVATTACAAPQSVERQPPIDASNLRLTQKPTIRVTAKTTAPKYPSSARNERVEGEVGLMMCVTERGAVRDVRVADSAGDDRLDKAAAEWSASLTFNPGLVETQPVEVCGHRVSVNWELNY